MLKKGLCFISAVVAVAALSVLCFAENVSTPGVTSGVYDIATGEQLTDNLDNLQEIVENSDKFDLADDSVLTVVVPSNLDFKIDPFKVNGRGQIYSEDFIIQNYSDKDVQINLNNIKYTFKNDEDFVSLDAPPDVPFGLANMSGFKEIYMVLHYTNQNLPDFVITTKETPEPADIILAASKYDDDGNFISLQEESVLTFNFSGIVNHMPSIEWQQGDISVSIEYTMTAFDETLNEEDEPENTEPTKDEGSETESKNDISLPENPQAAEPDDLQPPDLPESTDALVNNEIPNTETPPVEEKITDGEDIPAEADGGLHSEAYESNSS